MKLIKYLYHVLTIKDVLDDGVYTLSYFHKNSVKSCNNLWLFYWWLLLMIINDYWLLMVIIIIDDDYHWWLLKKIVIS